MSNEVFGPLVLEEEVRSAVVALTTWAPSYLARIERKLELEPESIPLPASFALSDEGGLGTIAAEQLPRVVVLSPGSGERKPSMDGEGNYRASFALNLTAVVEDADQASADLLAGRYRKALEMALVQQPSLGGLTEGLVFKGWRTEVLEVEGERFLAAATTLFEVLVPNVVQAGAGLKEPREDPYEEAEWPQVEEVDVDLEAKNQ
jgi:hypothetical protein